MHIGDLDIKIAELNEDERAAALTKLWDLLSPPSQQQLLDFQRQWDGSKSYTEFVTAQN